jgi:4-amino-4-deoxy-L-arabinose transferase-like glycosyltransferase
MWSSFWRDETETYWVVTAGFREISARAQQVPGFSFPYYALAWLAVKIGGTSEVVLRVPSILTMLLTTWLLYRVGNRLTGDEGVGLWAALVFVGMRDVAFAACDARPYSLAVLFLTGHILALLRWLDGGRSRDAIAASVLAALTAHTQPLLALGLIVPALYAWWRTSRRGGLVAQWIAAALLVMPLVLQQWAMLRQYGMDWPSSAAVPEMRELFLFLSPPTMVTCLGAGLLLGYLVVPAMRACWVPGKASTLLIVGCATGPTIVCFLISRLSSAQVFLPRYLLSTAPGAALLAGCVIRAFGPEKVRRIMAAVMVLLVTGAFAVVYRFHHGGEDWRATMAAVRSTTAGTDTPVLFSSVFAQSSSPLVFANPNMKDLLRAPTLMYPPGGRVIVLPFKAGSSYLKMVLEEAASHDRFLLVSDGQTTSWFRERMAERHASIEELPSSSGPLVTIFRPLVPSGR